MHKRLKMRRNQIEPTENEPAKLHKAWEKSRKIWRKARLQGLIVGRSSLKIFRGDA